MTLPDLQERWIDLFWQMSRDPSVVAHFLAAPFLSVEPKGYNPHNHKTILYIGKATSGSWFLDGFRADPTVHARQATTTKFLGVDIDPDLFPSPFWKFARELNELTLTAEERLHQKNELTPTKRPLQNIVWSNIAKIGVQKDNPEGKYLTLQADLATKTLTAEIEHYQPSLIVFVSARYGEQIVRDVFRNLGAEGLFVSAADGRDDNTWRNPSEHVWWRARDTKLAAALCLYHPQFKSLTERQDWVQHASALLGR